MNEPDPKLRPPDKPLPRGLLRQWLRLCVFTVYAEEMEAYAQRLSDWRQRHPDEPTGD